LNHCSALIDLLSHWAIWGILVEVLGSWVLQGGPEKNCCQ